MATTVVMVHGIRTSATMWRAQVEHLRGRGIDAVALDLPGHGARMGEPFTLDGAFATIDGAVRDAATRGRVLLVGHSMGGLVSIEYVGAAERPPVDAFIAASCTAIPRGVALQTYRTLARGFDRLPAAAHRSPSGCSIARCPSRRGPTSAPVGMRMTRRTPRCAACRCSTCSPRCVASRCRRGS
jgi:alpha-beta hydrolase superfamily lysophospholipase